MDKNKLFVECDCYTHAIVVDRIDEDGYGDYEYCLAFFERGFDGNIICEVESGCQHEITLSPNVLIQKGNTRGENCLEGIEPAKERTEERDRDNRYNLGVSDYMSDNFVVSDTSSSKESKPKEPKQSRFKPRFKPNHSYPPPTPLDTFGF
jgi:hypothetical protein